MHWYFVIKESNAAHNICIFWIWMYLQLKIHCVQIFLFVDLFFTDDLEWGGSFTGRGFINNLESELILNTTHKPHEIWNLHILLTWKLTNNSWYERRYCHKGIIANALIVRWILISKILRQNVGQQNKLFNFYDLEFLH